MTTPLSWNRIPRLEPDLVHALHDRSASLPEALPRPLLAYGNGRSYGDACLTDHGTLLLTRGLDKFIEFNAQAGILRCEAGVTLAEILALCVPCGWFLPVTPGTQYATVGGAVANDVHGKNHHRMGSFGHHVRRLELLRSNGDALRCGPGEHEDWFRATVGGLGLTGLIRWVEIQLLRINNPWMWVSSRRFPQLEQFWEMNAAAEAEWPYSVAWVDCTAGRKARGRGILLAGQHAGAQPALPSPRSRRWSMPLDAPFNLLNSVTLRAFNALYYRQPVKPHGGRVHYSRYFYPLDSISHWNRIYGSKGFYQYQCVVPPEVSREAVKALLDAIARYGTGSFLAVLKTLGNKASPGMLSFPRPGATLALDFPNQGARTLTLFNELDAIVQEAGGALYPAKDARMPARLFRSGFPAWEAFSYYVDPAFCSHFWKRVNP